MEIEWERYKERYATLHRPKNLKVVRVDELVGDTVEIMHVGMHVRKSYPSRKVRSVPKKFMVVAFGPHDYAFVWLT